MYLEMGYNWGGGVEEGNSVCYVNGKSLKGFQEGTGMVRSIFKSIMMAASRTGVRVRYFGMGGWGWSDHVGSNHNNLSKKY